MFTDSCNVKTLLRTQSWNSLSHVNFICLSLFFDVTRESDSKCVEHERKTRQWENVKKKKKKKSRFIIDFYFAILLETTFHTFFSPFAKY